MKCMFFAPIPIQRAVNDAGAAGEWARPSFIKVSGDSISLTAYAVSTRYPGDFEPVDEEEYQEALEIAERVFDWINKQFIY